MIIERSRAWVKARIPAFICKETSWWVTRWIQANVFLCPHCKQEYRSLKKVWDCLDEWEEDAPSPECELQFSSKFREQFPSAFRQEEEEHHSVLHSWYGKVGFAGGVLAVGFACMVVLQTDDTSPVEKSNGDVDKKIVKVDDAPESSAQQVAKKQEEETDQSSIEQEYVPNLKQNDLIPPSENYPMMKAKVRTVSLDDSTPQRSNVGNSGFGRHAVEINNHRVAGFSALTYSTEEDAY